MRIITFIMFAVLTIPNSAYASRVDKINSLSDCIKKADIIVLGFVRSIEDIKDKGVLKVSVLRVLKGSIEQKEISIASYGQHSKSELSPEGPIKVEAREAYIFFITPKPNDEGQYLMFNDNEGVIQSSNPVSLEIEKQLEYSLLSLGENISDISVDFYLVKRSGIHAVIVSLKNDSDKEVSLSHPDFINAIAFVVFDSRGNPITPTGIAKVTPKIQKFSLKPKETFEHTLHQYIKTDFVFPFLTGTALFGYELKEGNSYRVIAIYRPYGKERGGICSKEKIIEFR